MLAPRYRDRRDAGQALARLLRDCAGRNNTLILALPRGGVPVGFEISASLGAPLDVFLVRKLGLPDQPELAMGAIASGGVRLLDDARIAEEQVSAAVVAEITARETAELKRREVLYRGDRPAPDFSRRRVILVDDGVATGYTMRVAVLALRRLGPATITIAVPVGAPETCAVLANTVDELICPLRPDLFQAVGYWYDRFPAVTDDEVRECLAHAAPSS